MATILDRLRHCCFEAVDDRVRRESALVAPRRVGVTHSEGVAFAVSRQSRADFALGVSVAMSDGVSEEPEKIGTLTIFNSENGLAQMSVEFAFPRRVQTRFHDRGGKVPTVNGPFCPESSLSCTASRNNAQTQIEGGHYEPGRRSLLRVLSHGSARRPCGGQASARAGV